MKNGFISSRTVYCRCMSTYKALQSTCQSTQVLKKMELAQAMEKAIQDHVKALDHESAMSSKLYQCKMEFEENKLVMGPLYWELVTKVREATEAYKAAEKLTLEAEEVMYRIDMAIDDLKPCTFCGRSRGVCGEDHGDEMRDIQKEFMERD